MATTYGYAPGAVLPSNVGPLGTFVAHKAPTTNSTVYTANIASGAYKGQTLYVGPDNQPWVGASSAFYSAQPGYINPITSKAQKVTWQSLLGVANTDPYIAASTYTGPGANTTAQELAAYSPSNVPVGESLVVGPNAAVAIAHSEAPGVYAGSLNMSPAVTQAAPFAAPNAPPAATAPSAAAAFLAAVAAATGNAPAAAAAGLPSIPTTLTSTGTGQAVNISTTHPGIAAGVGSATGTTADTGSASTNAATSDAINQALANGINGGYSSSPLDAVNGSPSEAAGLEALQPAAVQTGGTSSSNPILLFVIIGILAIVGFVVYLKLRHKGPPPPGTSTAHTIATGDKVEPVTA